MSKEIDFLTYTGPISPNARRQAEQFSKQFNESCKAEQIRLNTLSVLFVNSYLQFMGIETDLEASDSQNPLQQIYLDIADLSLKNNLYLECRPVLEGEKSVYIPPESQSNRVSYVAVQISKSFREAKLLGFIKEVKNDYIPINQLQPLDNLLDCLENLTENLTQDNHVQVANNSVNFNSKLVDLKQWFDNVFDVGWQEVTSLLTTTAHPTLVRGVAGNFVSRGKLVNLGKTNEQKVILIVTATPENEREMDVIIEVHPTTGKTYLFPYLHLTVLDADGEAVMEAHTRNHNKNIQLEFSNDLEEHFSVKLTLGDVSAIENFVT